MANLNVENVYSISGNLDGELKIKFCLRLTDAVINDPQATLTITGPDATKIIFVKDILNSPVIINGETCYVFDFSPVAKELHDILSLSLEGEEIDFCIYKRDSNVPFQNDVWYEKFLGAQEEKFFNKDLSRLAWIISNYGYAAQKYLDYNVTEKTKVDPEISEVSDSEFDQYINYKAADADKPEGFSNFSYSLILESEVSLKAIIKYIDDADPHSFTYYVNGVETEVQWDNNKHHWYIIASHLTPRDFNSYQEFTISKDGKSYYLRCCILSYCRGIFIHAKPTTQIKIDLAKAIYLYNNIAETYFKLSSTNSKSSLKKGSASLQVSFDSIDNETEAGEP